MTLWHEIDDLQKKRAELEFQLHSPEKKKEKTLEERLAAGGKVSHKRAGAEG